MSRDLTDDETLVREAQRSTRGDHRAFAKLVDRHLGHVQANCEHLSGSRDEGEDLAQEVMVKAFFALDGLEDGARFRGWISRIKKNHCLDHLRRRRKCMEVDLEQAQESQDPWLSTPPPPEADWSVRARRERIRRVLHSMPEDLRVPVILCDMDGLSYQEVADSLGLGLSAVKMRIKRGREMFRERHDRELKRLVGKVDQNPFDEAAHP